MIDELRELGDWVSGLLGERGGYIGGPGALDDRDRVGDACLRAEQVLHGQSRVHVMVQPVDPRLQRALRGRRRRVVRPKRQDDVILEQCRAEPDQILTTGHCYFYRAGSLAHVVAVSVDDEAVDELVADEPAGSNDQRDENDRERERRPAAQSAALAHAYLSPALAAAWAWRFIALAETARKEPAVRVLRPVVGWWF